MTKGKIGYYTWMLGGYVLHFAAQALAALDNWKQNPLVWKSITVYDHLLQE